MGTGTKISLRDSIATRMLLVILGLYLLVAITVTVSHVLMEYKYQKENIIQDLGDIEQAFKNGLAVSLWGLDELALKASVEGMLKIPTLVGVKVTNSERATIAIGGIVTDLNKMGKVGLHVNLFGCSDEEKAIHEDGLYNLEMFERQFSITYDLDGENLLLGQATIYSNSSVIYRRMKLQVAMLSINVVLTLLTFSMALLWVVNRYLRKPLGILTNATENISLNNLGSFSIDTKTFRRNEIKVLEESMNFMVTDLHEAISKRKKTEVSLRESEQYLRSIFRAAPIGIGVSIDRKLIQINEQICKMTGYTEEELITQNARMLYQSEDAYEQVGRRVYKQIQDHGTGIVETCWKRKDDCIINVLISSTPLDRGDPTKGITFAVLDITALKGAELALWKSEKKYRTLFEKSNDAIFIVEKSTGIYLDANYAASVLTGRTLEELKQLTTQDITPHDSHDRLKRIKESDKAEELGTVTYHRPDNSFRFAKLSKIPLDDLSVIGIARDITDDLKMEQQLRQSQKMESVGTLAGGIAHDFNNILFPILGHAEMLLEDAPEDSTFRNSLNGIYTGALRASELVKQILTFSRQDTNELKLMKIQPIIKEVLKLIRSTIPTTIEIKQDIHSDCGMIIADPTQIHQIIMNLATNSYHAMEETGGEVKVSLKEIELGEYDVLKSDMKPGMYACLTIADTGIGMDKELIRTIFDPFFTTKEKGKGTGMGLSVVHGIVENMNGAIQVYSEPGEGTQFHVYLPVKKIFFEEQVIHSKTEIQGGTEQVLLVDDDEAILTMEKEMLERMGYQVTSRTSSIEALEAFRGDSDKFDLVITDMAMPNMPGDQFAVELTKIRSNIPILLCTGFSETMSEEKAASLGIKGFLWKPIVMKDLAKKIRDVL